MGTEGQRDSRNRGPEGTKKQRDSRHRVFKAICVVDAKSFSNFVFYIIGLKDCVEWLM